MSGAKDKAVYFSLLYSVSDSLLAYIGDPTNLQGADFVVLGLQGGRIAVYFNDLGGFGNTAIGITELTYNDSEIHQIRMVFQGQEEVGSGQLELVVDSNERVIITGTITIRPFFEEFTPFKYVLS